MAVRLQTRRFDVDEYHRMAAAGILRRGDRVELIEGEIVEMVPIGPPHTGGVDYLTRRFVLACGDRAIVRVQGPVRLDRHSEPQPDLLLLKPRADFYRDAHPGPSDVLLLVEVAQSSIDYDREVKVPLYNRFGIPEVWIVDLPVGRVEVYRTPSPDGYRDVQNRARGEQVTPAAFPALAIPIGEILG
jgi:Uma2 family endonuclease